MATYSEKLADPRWQKKRLEIMSRDNWACKKCLSTTNTLHVHHVKYIYGNEPWDYPDSNFETLCKVCHGKEHKVEAVFQVIGQIISPPTVISLMNDQLNSLQRKLQEPITDELQEDILKNIMFLTNKKKELLRNGK